MSTQKKNTYCFIHDESKKYYRATVNPDGKYIVVKNSLPYPISFNPTNLNTAPIEFGTNIKYFSLNRSISYPLDFVKDGAEILRQRFLLGKGTEEKMYVVIVDWNGVSGRYEMSYSGKIDFSKKNDYSKSGIFSVSTIDDSAWGVLSQNDDVEYAIELVNNPKAIKVLIDDVTLKNVYTYQPVNAPMTGNNFDAYQNVPLALVNQDGDSSGIITKNQQGDVTVPLLPYAQSSGNWFLNTLYPITGMNIKGEFTFTWGIDYLPSGGLEFFFYTSTGQKFDIFSQLSGMLTPGKIYNVAFDININMASGEKIFFFGRLIDLRRRHFTIHPVSTNIYVSTLTKTEPTVIYGLRPLDLVKEIVNKATYGRYTIKSDYFSSNKNDILTSGDAIRGVQNAKIYTSFQDFFKSFDCLKYMALRVIDGELWIEEADEIYKRNSTIFDLGEVLSLETSPASELMINSIKVGSPKQDYRHQSGRLEFNSENKFSLPIVNSKKELDIVSKYRLDCYGIIFLILDYRGGSTQDNLGDKDVFVINITDDLISATEDVSTFENISINSSPLSPIIKLPLTGDLITYKRPYIRGIAPVGSTVNIYVFDTLDGSAITNSNGIWEYNISNDLPSYNPGVFDGLSIIKASFTDTLAPVDSVSIIIDTTASTQSSITYPKSNDSIYNNKPLIKGTAHAGTNINITLDGVFLASVVANNSCKWEYKILTVLSNGTHSISINGGASSIFKVNSSVSFPLITYIGYELDGFVIINNLPLIQGVAIPGSIVEIFLNYISYVPLGSAIADADGNWSFQVVPTSYIDPLSLTPVQIAPIQNGLNVFSTSLVNRLVQIDVTGFKLNRPNFDSIEGVLDNSVFNVLYSPKRMLIARKSFLSSVCNQIRNEVISFQKPDKNSELKTILGLEVIQENSDIPISSLGTPIALLEYAKIKTKALASFSKTLYNFNNGGIVKASFRGNEFYLMPIGSMKMNSIHDTTQEWKLLFSPENSYIDILNLYRNGITIKLMKNAIYHSDFNTLHMVIYDFQRSSKYNVSTIYQDWFENRNDFWVRNPLYVQKLQTTETITDQIVTNGVSGVSLKMYRCFDASFVHSVDYEPVTPSPIDPPDIVMEAKYDMSLYPPDQYFFIIYVGSVPVSISERIETRERWDRTILIESSNSVNLTGFFYSTGAKTILRVEGIIKKLQPDAETIVAKDDFGNTDILYGNVSRKRIIRFGTAYGLPDYLYLKIANAIVNDDLLVEGVSYTLSQDDKIENAEEHDGHPLYYYNILVNLKENVKGTVFGGVADSDTEGVVLVIDATAFGLPAGTLTRINLD